MVGIIIEDEAAVEERERLLQDGTEISVTVKERDAWGKKKTTRLQFGMNASTAWVYCQNEREGMEPQKILEAVLTHDAHELFQGYLERMMIRQGLVDPSPLSAEFVEIGPCIEYVVRDIDAEFGIKISLR